MRRVGHAPPTDSARAEAPAPLAAATINSLTLASGAAAYGALTMRVVALLSAAVYAAASMSGVLVNKAVFASFSFNYPLVILLLQLCVTTVGMVVAAPPVAPERFAPLVPVALAFVMNVFAGLLALQVTNVPMFSAFRRLSVLSVMITETVVFGRRETRYVELSVAVMTLGSLVAALGDAQANLLGYALVFVNNFATAAYLVVLKRAAKTLKLGSVAMTFYVNLVSIPIALLICIVTGQLQAAVATMRATPALRGGAFVFAIVASSCSAFAINLSTLWCTSVNTPLTTAIAGQTKNMLQTMLGLVLWDFQLTALNIFGLLVAAVGSGLFGHAKFVVVSGSGEGGGAPESNASSDDGGGTGADKRDAGDATGGSGGDPVSPVRDAHPTSHTVGHASMPAHAQAQARPPSYHRRHASGKHHDETDSERGDASATQFDDYAPRNTHVRPSPPASLSPPPAPPLSSSSSTAMGGAAGTNDGATGGGAADATSTRASPVDMRASSARRGHAPVGADAADAKQNGARGGVVVRHDETVADLGSNSHDQHRGSIGSPV